MYPRADVVVPWHFRTTMYWMFQFVQLHVLKYNFRASGLHFMFLYSLCGLDSGIYTDDNDFSGTAIMFSSLGSRGRFSVHVPFFGSRTYVSTFSPHTAV